LIAIFTLGEKLMSSNVLEVFWFSGSPYVWRVMLTLEAKEIAYTSRLLQASLGEHKTPEFLALSPRGKVPALRDGDFVVYESIAIMQYLEAKYPARPLFGRNAQETATIWRVISEFSSYLEPQLFRVDVLLLTGKSQEAAAEVRAALPGVLTELDKLEASLAHGPWLLGADTTAADITVYPFVKLLMRGAEKEAAVELGIGSSSLHQRYPRLATWMKHVEQLPGYERTYPPHWRPASKL
jgi:glutathione S-transferase